MFPRSHEVVVRTDARLRRQAFAWLPVFILVLAAGAALFVRALQMGVRPSFVVGVPLVIVAGFGGFLFLNLRNAALFADAERFGRAGFLGRRRTWQRSELDHVEERLVTFGQGAQPQLLFVGHGRKLLLMVPAQRYAADDVRRLLAAMEVELVRKPAVRGGARLRREFPASVPWWLAHPLLAGFLLAPLVMAVLAALLIAIGRR